VLDLDLGRRSAFLVLIGLGTASAIAGRQLIDLAYPPSVLGRSVFEGVFFGGLSMALLVIAAAWVLDATVSRAGFCRSVCPGGAVFRALGAPAPLQIRRDPDACIHCHACDEVCNLGQYPMSDRHTTGCERCGSCAAVCPTDALIFTLGRPLPILPPERPSRSDDA
jgi:ferredoxin-type protein NapH